jgi:hypothetical protein
MLNVEDKRKEIEAVYAEVSKAASDFNKSLMKFRNISLDFDKENTEEVNQAMGLGHDIDMRVAFVLRSLLVQHGNVLFL